MWLTLEGIEYGLDEDGIIVLTARGLKHFIAFLSSLAIVLVIALAAASFVPRAFGYTLYAVLSGSMEPESCPLAPWCLFAKLSRRILPWATM